MTTPYSAWQQCHYEITIQKHRNRMIIPVYDDDGFIKKLIITPAGDITLQKSLPIITKEPEPLPPPRITNVEKIRRKLSDLKKAGDSCGISRKLKHQVYKVAKAEGVPVTIKKKENGRFRIHRYE